MVLFLHGAGERGSNNLSQLTHGGLMFTNPVNREKYPAFVNGFLDLIQKNKRNFLEINMVSKELLKKFMNETDFHEAI